MIQSISNFIDYFESIRRRTNNYIQVLPADRLGWSPREGEFTCGDLVRHIGAAETMYVKVFADGRWDYPGHDSDPNVTLDEIKARMAKSHEEAMTRLRAVSDTELLQPRPTINGPAIKAWRLLMMMVEHEVHHRSQLAVYLSLMGVQPPQIYGISLEEVIARLTA
jgi:uncharacterized damage-inducible protein DinB